MSSQSPHLFIFGRQPEFGAAELFSWLSQEANLAKIDLIIPEAAITNGFTKKASEITNTLAGVVKAGEVIKEISLPTKAGEWVKLLEPLVKSKLTQGGALTFGLSFYGATAPNPKSQQRIALELKKLLRVSAGHVRWVSGRGQPLSSVVVVKNKLMSDSAIELIIVCAEKRATIGRTVSVQPFEEWGERDYGRPRRNAKQGMLPPKLAHMMVNMLGLASRGVLLDPFCGSGTVLMEAALLGWKNIIGADKENMAIKDTDINLKWLQDKYNIKLSSRLWQSDIKNLISKISPNSITAIVAEPFLGRPLNHAPDDREAAQISESLQPMYSTMITVFEKLLVKSGRAVFIAPAWRMSNGKIKRLNILDTQLRRGLRVLPFLGVSQKQLIYGRSGQYVMREIIRVERV